MNEIKKAEWKRRALAAEAELAQRPRHVELAFTADVHERPVDGFIHAEPGRRWIDLTVELHDGTTWIIRTPVVPDETIIERRTITSDGPGESLPE